MSINSMAAAAVPALVSAFTRQVAVAAGIPYTRAFSLSRNPHATQVYRQMLRAARSFKNLNFRDYFVRRVSGPTSKGTLTPRQADRSDKRLFSFFFVAFLTAYSCVRSPRSQVISI